MFYLCISLLVFVLSLGYGGIDQNPATGSVEFRFISEEEEIAIGNTQFHPEPIHCPPIQEYVQSVGDRIAAVSDRPNLPYEFIVTDDLSTNASSFPGGKILITRGFLMELKSEAELAAILAHEIAHANLRHVAKGLERRYLFDAVPGLFELMGELFDLAHCRDEEYEADHYGVKYMAAAGYDPQAAEDVMARLLGEDVPGLELLSTHPLASNRIIALRSMITEFRPEQPLKLAKDHYHAKYEHLMHCGGRYSPPAFGGRGKNVLSPEK